MTELPDDHPLAPYADQLDTHQDHLNAYSGILEDADEDTAQAVMLIVTGEQGTDTLPSVSEDVDARFASLWMLGAHIHHVASSASAASGNPMEMREAAEHAINQIQQHEGTQEVYDDE